MSTRKNRIIIVSVLIAIAIGIGVLIGSLAGYLSLRSDPKTVSESMSSMLSSDLNLSQIPSSVEEESSTIAMSSVPPVSSNPASSKKPPVSSSAASSKGTSSHPLTDLSKLYPDLYVQPKEIIEHQKGDKVAYLTFDDGPSVLTPKVLDILKQNDIKATFFVVGRSDPQSKNIMKDIVDQGHTIAMHTYTHDYEKIYASPTAFLDDMSKVSDLIEEATGVKPELLRFAGGSVNSYNKAIARQLANDLTRRGYTYYDWNVSAGDAERGATKQSIYQDTINQTVQFEKAVILFHDSGKKHDTVEELPKIIQELKSKGYRFDKLDSSVKPIQFKLPAQ